MIWTPLSPDESHIVNASLGSQFASETSRPISQLEHDNELFSVAMSPDGITSPVLDWTQMSIYGAWRQR